MKGISFITDHENRRKAIIIELQTLEKHPNQVEDLWDVLVSESRKSEPKLDWQQVKAGLKKAGKL